MSLTKRQEKRQQRAQDFANQNIKKAKNFDFDQHNRKDVTDGTHVSGQEARYLSKNFGQKEAYQAMQAQKDAGAVFGERAQSKFDRMGERIEARQRAKAAKGSTGQETNAIDDAQSGAGDSVDNNGTIIESGRDSNLGANSGSHTVGDNNSGIVGNSNTNAENNADNSIDVSFEQKNPQEAKFTGSNNTVIQTADNSVRTYGGDNRSFIYNSTGGGKGGLYDSPVSAATMGGFYDVNDSPAAQAAFVDMHSTLNADNQKRYAGDAMEVFAQFGNLDARDYTDETMETNLGRSLQDSYDRADAQTGHVLGDVWNNDYITEDWVTPKPPSEIKSNAGELAEEAKDDLEDV